MKAKLYFLASFFYTAFILLLSLVNLKKVDIVKFNASDKFYHTACYAIMVFIWSFYLVESLLKIQIKHKLVLAGCIILFGIIIEYLQLFLTNYRSFDWWDVLANCLGVLIGSVAFLVIQKLFNL